jgi:type VI secretion system protein ImpF
MPRDDDLTVTQSVLDRLIDREPNLASDPSITRAQSIRQLKASLRRDMEWLLNTRRNAEEPEPDTMTEVARSLYSYGLPDFTRFSSGSSRDRNQLILELESTVAMFEPRLRDIRVTLLDDTDTKVTRAVHFQIEGMLQMDPAPEQVSFDTVLQLNSGEYQIRGDRGA